MENNKSPCNDGLTKEFYCPFRNEIKNIFIYSLRQPRCLKALGTSLKQAIIRLPEKSKKIIYFWLETYFAIQRWPKTYTKKC